jgi:hypothetical protein
MFPDDPSNYTITTPIFDLSSGIMSIQGREVDIVSSGRGRAIEIVTNLKPCNFIDTSCYSIASSIAPDLHVLFTDTRTPPFRLEAIVTPPAWLVSVGIVVLIPRICELRVLVSQT